MKKTSLPISRFLFGVAAVAGLFSSQIAQADTAYWNINTASTWITTGNWSLNSDGTGSVAAVPGASDIAYFGSSLVNGSALTARLSAALSVGGIVVTNTGGTSINVNNSTPRTITIGSSGIDVQSGAGDLTFINTSTRSVSIAVGANQTWTNNGSGTITQGYDATLPASLSLGSNTLTIAGTGATTLNAPISGSGATAIVKNGSGTLTLSSNNTFSGEVVVNAGTLDVTAGAAGNTVTALGSGTLTLNNGSTLSLGNRIIANNVTIGAGTATISGNAKLTGLLSGSGNISHTATGPTFALQLTGVNTGFSGNITNDATIALGNKDALGTGVLIMNAEGAKISAGATLTGANAIANNIVLNGTMLFGSTGNASDFELSGVISGTGGLATDHLLADVTLSGANTYQGTTTVEVASLTATGSSALGATTGALVVGNKNSTAAGTNIVLNLSTTADTTKGSLSGTIATPTSGTNTATINNGGRRLTINQTANGTYQGVIAGTGGFTLGALSNRTLTLTGVNTYTGTTIVSAGTLVVNGSLAAGSAVTVDSGATLGGNGTIGGNVTVAGNLNPGNSPGILTVDGDLTLQSTATTTMEITGTTSGTFDQVVGINAMTLDGALVLSLTGTYGTASWDLFDFASETGNFASITLSGSYSGILSRTGDLWTGNIGGQDWTFSQLTGDLSVVPEPSTWALLAGGLTVVMVLRRRRNA